MLAGALADLGLVPPKDFLVWQRSAVFLTSALLEYRSKALEYTVPRRPLVALARPIGSCRDILLHWANIAGNGEARTYRAIGDGLLNGAKCGVGWVRHARLTVDQPKH